MPGESNLGMWGLREGSQTAGALSRRRYKVSRIHKMRNIISNYSILREDGYIESKRATQTTVNPW